MTLSREAKLGNAAAFRFVFDAPQVSRDAMFRVLSRPNGLEFSRLGMAVSRRTCRRATGRNRVKRIIRESFRLHRERMAGRNAKDIVVLPNARATTATNEELFESLRGHWRKLIERDTAPEPGASP